MATEIDHADTPAQRLRTLIVSTYGSTCPTPEKGNKCKCTLCDFCYMLRALAWYGSLIHNANHSDREISAGALFLLAADDGMLAYAAGAYYRKELEQRDIARLEKGRLDVP